MGGGAITKPKVANLVKEHCQVIWLWVSPKQLLQRASSSFRPLLGQYIDERKLEKLLLSRIPAYASVADLVIPNPTDNPQITAERIIYEIS